MGKKTYTPSDVKRYGEYYHTKESNSYAIRRDVHLINGRVTSDRLSPSYYKKEIEGLQDKEEIELVLKGICKKENIKQFGKNYERKLALVTLQEKSPWITKPIRKEFYELIESQRKNSKDYLYINKLFETKFLKFFIDLAKISNPNEWASAQHLWGLSLMNTPKNETYRIWEDKNFCPSLKTIKTIIQTANLFIDFLKRKDPKEYSGLSHLVPITKNKLKDHEQNRGNGEDNVGLFITENHWRIIAEKLQDITFITDPKYLNGYDIFPFIKLGYDYGLRRNETLGVLIKENEKINDVKEGGLLVERQLSRLLKILSTKVVKDKNGKDIDKKFVEWIPKYTGTKGKYKRLTPHWFSTARETYQLIKKIGAGQCKIIHPDTLTDKWKVVIDYLLETQQIDKDYDIHDLRRTFITRALKEHPPLTVMKAVGHKRLETTLRYLVSERNLSEEDYVPDAV